MAIDIANNGYKPQSELTKITAAPSFQDIQVRRDPNESRAYQLATQLGALEPQINDIRKQVDISDKQKAEALVNSMTTDELAAKIKENPLELAGSPIFNATVNNLHYANIAHNTERDTLQKLSTGDLSFPDDPESKRFNPDGSSNPQYRTGSQRLEEHLLNQRNQLLAGADKYGVAGYDRNWQPFVQKALADNAQNLAVNSLNYAKGVANDSYNAALAGSGTAEEKIARFMQADSGVKNITLPKDRAEVRIAALDSLASAGDVQTVKGILGTKLDNGITLGSTLGKNNATNILERAQRVFEVNQNKAVVQFNQQRSDASVMAVDNQMAELIRQGRGTEIKDEYQIWNADGTQGYRQTSAIKPRILDSFAKTHNLNTLDRLQLFVSNGAVDKDTQNIIEGGAMSLSSINFDDPKKPMGELSPQFKKGFDLYQAAKGVDSTGNLSSKLAGSEDNARMYESIDMISRMSGKTTEEAALVEARYQAKLKSGTLVIKGADSAGSTIVDSLNNGFFMRNLFGADDNPVRNIDNVKKEVAETIKKLVYDGASIADATKLVQDNISTNLANINGNLMYRRSIPSIPEITGKDSQVVGGSETMMKRFLSDVGGQAASQTGFNPKEVEVTVNPAGDVFTLNVKGSPLYGKGAKFQYSTSDIQDWMKRDLPNVKTELAQKTAREAYAYTLKNKLLVDTSIANVNARSTNTPLVEYLSSAHGYRKLVDAKMLKKPLEEQLKWAKDRMANGEYANQASTPIGRQ